MLLTRGRNLGTSSAPPPLTQWINHHLSQPPSVLFDTLDARRATQLLRTLPTRSDSLAPCVGDELPQGHHLVYFQPETPFLQLGRDGSSTDHSPPAPFLRRMWAGGSMAWNGRAPPLRIGEGITQRTKVVKAEHKKGMVFVYQQRNFYEGSGEAEKKAGDERWAVREVRTHVFRPDEQPGQARPGQEPLTSTTSVSTSPDVTFTYLPTSPVLFRYSALTFNAHKIHYDRPWTQSMEGHPDLLVHAPLTANLLIELAAREGRIGNFEYRAVKPMYVDREITLAGKWAGEQGEGEGEGRRLEMWAEQEGRVGMRASAWVP